MTSSSPLLCPFRHLEGSPGWSPSLLLSTSGTKSAPLTGLLLRCLLCQVFEGPAFLLFSSWVLLCGERESIEMTPTLMHDSAVSPCLQAARVSSTGVCHHHLPLHIPWSCLHAVNSRPQPEIAPQPVRSSSQQLCLLGNPHPCLGCLWLRQRLSV